MTHLEKERKTIAVMIRIFCCAHHETGKKTLCTQCSDLLDYAEERLRRCPFRENKGACSKCRIHCYKPEMREQITRVMRYSGPKMLSRHPLLAVDHLLKLKLWLIQLRYIFAYHLMFKFNPNWKRLIKRKLLLPMDLENSCPMSALLKSDLRTGLVLLGPL